MLSSVQSVIAPSPSLSSAVHSSMIQEHSSYDTFSTLLPMPFLHPSLLALLEKEASPYAQATNFQFTSQSASTITANEFRDSVVRTIADMDLRRPVLQLIGDKDRESSPSILVSSSTSDRSSISPSGPPTVIARLEGGGAFVNPGSRTKKKELVKDDAYWQRRRKNNDAAKRSRDSRKIKEDEIAAKAESLERENFQLRMQVENLRAETDQLRGLVLAASPRSHALPRPSLSILTSPVSTTHSSTFSSSSSVSSTTMQLMLPCEKASTKYHSPVQEIRAPVPIRPMPNMPNSSSVIARNSVLVANIIG